MQNIINYEELDIIIKKVEMYLREENIILTELQKTFEEILFFYKSNNSNKINEIQEELDHKFPIIQKNHQTSITFLKDKINTYKQTIKKNEVTLKRSI